MFKKQTNMHPSYRADIDGLRALAVVPVVVFHAFPTLIPGGFIGVDIFFVISGFLISSIIFKSVGAGSFSFTDFYIKRANRIFPSLTLVLSVCMTFGWFVLYSDEYAQLGKHTAAGAGFVANIALLLESGYFDTASNTKILLHLWSLGIEEQFYLLWPTIILLFKRSRASILCVLILILSASFIANVFYIGIDPTVTFYSPVTRFWELAFGALLAYLNFNNKNSIGYMSRHCMSVVGFIAILASFVLMNEEGFPGWKAIIPVMGSFLLIAAGKDALFNRYVLSNRVMVFIGLVSYPLYLWHWPVFSYLRIINSGEVSPEMMTAAIAISFLMAVVTYYAWEKPLRFSARKARTAIVLTICMALLGVAGYLIFNSGGVHYRKVVKDAAERNSEFGYKAFEYNNDICANRYPFAESKNYKWFFCAMNKNQSPEILLLGTSFANQHYYGFTHTPELNGKAILSIGACDPATPDVSKRKDNHPCALDRPGRQRELIQGIISREHSIKYVIIDGLTTAPTKQYSDNLKKYVGFIIDNGATPIVFYPHAFPNFDTKACFSRPLSSPVKSCHLDASYYKQNVYGSGGIGLTAMFESLKKSYPQVKFFNQNDVYCNADGCDSVKDGMPMFSDGRHYSNYGSMLVTKSFIEWAAKNEPGILN